MKKLAFPTDNGNLSHHFGHSREFYFFEIEANSITRKYTQEPPPHAEGTIPKWLAAEKVTMPMVLMFMLALKLIQQITWLWILLMEI